ERRVALDDEQLAAVVGGAAVDELGRERGVLQRVLAALVVALGAGGDAGLGRADDLLQDGAQLLLLAARRVLEELAQLARDDLGDDAGRGGGAEDLLRLAL